METCMHSITNILASHFLTIFLVKFAGNKPTELKIESLAQQGFPYTHQQSASKQSVYLLQQQCSVHSGSGWNVSPVGGNLWSKSTAGQLAKATAIYQHLCLCYQQVVLALLSWCQFVQFGVAATAHWRRGGPKPPANSNGWQTVVGWPCLLWQECHLFKSQVSISQPFKYCVLDVGVYKANVHSCLILRNLTSGSVCQHGPGHPTSIIM